MKTALAPPPRPAPRLPRWRADFDFQTYRQRVFETTRAAWPGCPFRVQLSMSMQTGLFGNSFWEKVESGVRFQPDGAQMDDSGAWCFPSAELALAFLDQAKLPSLCASIWRPRNKADEAILRACFHTRLADKYPQGWRHKFTLLNSPDVWRVLSEQTSGGIFQSVHRRKDGSRIVLKCSSGTEAAAVRLYFHESVLDYENIRLRKNSYEDIIGAGASP